jgi:hypothetical protein
MDYCLWAWSHISQFGISTWYFIQPIFSSPTFAALVASILAPWFAIRTYLKQQRVSRIQRIYYEESLLSQLKHLDNVINVASRNLSYFENAINLVQIDLRRGGINNETITLLNNIANEMEPPVRYHSSNREILIILFKKYGYVMHQWLFKFDKDFIEFNSFMRELVYSLATRISQAPVVTEAFIREQGQEVDNTFKLVMRHYTFAFLFNQIISRVGALDFKSQNKLINNIASDKVIGSALRKIDETFKILFGYFRINENIYLSYLQDENGNRFRVNMNNTAIAVNRVQENISEGAEIIIVKNDLQLANATVEVKDSPRQYSLIQVGMANACAFNERPMFYREIESF